MPTFIDLFSGCGGFTLGMLRAGFDCLVAIDFNSEAVATLRDNLQAKNAAGIGSVGFVLKADLTTLTPETLAAVIGARPIALGFNDEIGKLKLDIVQIIPGHGPRLVTLGELKTVTGKSGGN